MYTKAYIYIYIYIYIERERERERQDDILKCTATASFSFRKKFGFKSPVLSVPIRLIFFYFKLFFINSEKWSALQITWRVFFTFMWPCIVTIFFIIKPTRCTNFITLFWHETLHVSDSNETPWSSILVLLESCLETCMVYTIAECTVSKLLMMDRGTLRNV